MILYHYTDLHLPGAEDEQEDIDSWARWEKYLNHFRQMKATLCVNTGDFCRSVPTKSIYLNIQKRLTKHDCPHILLAGNHDDADLMHDLLAEAQTNTYQADWDKWKVFCFNTSKGKLPHKDLELLQNSLNRHKKPHLVFMHHPPLFAGNPHMDRNYPLQNIDEVWPIFRKSPVPLHVFCGHYHMNREITERNCHIYVTASPYYNIDNAFTEVKKWKMEKLPFRKIILEEENLCQSLEWI